ncbi:ABC transporter ATP-binding protein [Prosthecobacter sp.]|uniref:ABC transporter ATP-binding protein n=1 Tax=Prosthecobacter sp. TaxID=1965333 RepID=UPI001DD023BB|nr:ABC transporter ATP-binding protein [Prosthecobacter sp.]MCB1276988.1 ABC transporter ATP-binding protein [Prosthecobacter sp.]
MAEPIIRVENLGKCYRIRHETRERYTALRDVIARKAKGIFNRASSNRHPESGEEDFWALKDVSFEIKQGEVVGIIGRNGAGKSTLLKILSRITEPTKGRITLNGRVASLLEVGTGFHPELTGRENIFLNGAILGMTKAEIRSKFDEIVAFAEVEKFLDTPVKRYSSGMYVRLAFAVAAHLEPEILVIDEVLAVGDAEFQKKCLGKMGEVARGGRTVLFVSHQMAAVQNLCQTGVRLVNGMLQEVGPVGPVIKNYLTQTHQIAQSSFANRRDRQGTGKIRFEEVLLRDAAGCSVAAFDCGAAAVMALRVTNHSGGPLRFVRVAVGVDNDLGQRITVWSTHLAEKDLPEVNASVHEVKVLVPRMTLAPGRYGYTLFCSVNGETADWIKNAGSFDVEPGDFFGSGQLPEAGQGWFLMEHQFDLSRGGAASSGAALN